MSCSNEDLMVIGKTRRSLLPQWIVDITILTAIRKHFPTWLVASYHFKSCHIHSRYEVHCSNSCSANTMAQAGKFNDKHSLKRCFIDVQNVLVVGCAVVQDNMKARWLTNIYQAKTEYALHLQTQSNPLVYRVAEQSELDHIHSQWEWKNVSIFLLFLFRRGCVLKTGYNCWVQFYN